MTMPNRTSFAGLLATFAVTVAAPVAAQTEIDRPGPYLNRGSGLIFPETFGPFTRTSVMEFDPDGGDGIIIYEADGAESEMIIFIDPLEELTCEQEFIASDAAMVRPGVFRWRGASELRLLPDAKAEQYASSYFMNSGVLTDDSPAMVTYSWIGCPSGGRWKITYSGHFSADDAVKGEKLTRRLFEGIDWTPIIGK